MSNGAKRPPRGRKRISFTRRDAAPLPPALPRWLARRGFSPWVKQQIAAPRPPAQRAGAQTVAHNDDDRPDPDYHAGNVVDLFWYRSTAAA